MKKLHQATFQGKNWQLITDNQAIKSALKAIGVKDDDYRCAYILTGLGDNTVAAINNPAGKFGQVGIKSPAVAASLSAFMTQISHAAGVQLMTTLFRRLQPPQKFRINISDIAKLLKIPKHLILRVECWAYIIFIHRADQGGQFISYRKLRQWQNAVACQIQNSKNCQQLRQLWIAIAKDYQKYSQQYDDGHYPFVCNIWSKSWDNLWKAQ
ncbi:MAG: hypothetical protein WBG73_15270 [Coleofasciculaceae cyanobacterium]